MTQPKQVDQINAFMNNSKIHYLFLRGSGGSGKTYALAKYLEKFDYKQHQYVFTGPTGKSVSVAEEKGMTGSTIHKWFRIMNKNTTQGINRQILSEFGTLQKYYLELKLKLESVKVFFIDEISMVNDHILEHIITTLYKVKPDLKVILAGDYHQLPSVIDYSKPEQHELESSIEMVKDIINDGDMEIIDFVTRYRSSDDEYNEFLHNLRAGRITNPSFISDFLRSKFNVYQDELPLETKKVLTFLAYNKTAIDAVNKELLDDIPGKRYSSKVEIPVDTYTTKKMRDRILEDFQYDDVVKFKVGSKILFRVNNQEGLWKNGDEGLIKDIQPGKITVEKLTPNGVREIVVNKHNFITTKTEMEDGYEIQAIQVPFSLANARTYHKSQGDGFLNIHLDLSFLMFDILDLETKWKVFYVGLSRVIDPSKVYIHEHGLNMLERQYRLFKKVNYNKLGLIDKSATSPDYIRQ